MTFAIVPLVLDELINKLLDEQLKAYPDIKTEDRAVLYSEILAFYDRHGQLPQFTIRKSTNP